MRWTALVWPQKGRVSRRGCATVMLLFCAPLWSSGQECGGACGSNGVSGHTRQTLADFWATGSLLSSNAEAVPDGHTLVEPYLFDDIAAGNAHQLFTTLLVQKGITDDFTVGVIPEFDVEGNVDGGSNFSAQRGDLTLRVKYQFLDFSEGRMIPATSLDIDETLPTGNYQNLGANGAAALGAGVFTTTIKLLSQYYFWTDSGRIVRARVNLSYAVSSSTQISNRSVYGTGAGSSGIARPGAASVANFSLEYSLTQRWVLAADLTYTHRGNTWVKGFDAQGTSVPGQGVTFDRNTGTAEIGDAAPALEYNFTADIGLIMGLDFSFWGRNIHNNATPLVAVNMLF